MGKKSQSGIDLFDDRQLGKTPLIDRIKEAACCGLEPEHR